MQVKVYEIAWGETVTSTGAIAGDVVTYNIAFTDQGIQGPVGPSGPQGIQGLPGDFVVNFRVVSAAETLVSKAKIAANTAASALTLTLPANPTNGDVIDFYDYAETFDTNNLTIARNGRKIEGLDENLVCNVKGAYFSLVYSGTTRGWQVLPSFGTSGGGGETVLTTQGDTLYRGVGVNQRLPIGSAGQILKVSAGGIPEWGAAPATGVTSVALSSSDLTVTGSPVTSSGTITANLSNSGVTAGTYSKVTVDAKGRVTTGATAGIADVTGLQTALDAKQPSGNYATLVNGTVPSNQLPSYVDDVIEAANLAAFPVTGESGKIYVAIDTRKTYRWSGSAYVEISPSEVTSVAGRTGAITLAVADVSDATPTSRTISAGTGLTGGGDLTANRTLTVAYGTTSGTACQGNDTRLSDSRTPTAHAASHASSGSDPLAPSDIGAQSVFVVEQLTITTSAQVNLTAARAKIFDIVQYAGQQVDVKLPSTNAQNADTFVFRWATGNDSIRIINSSSPSDIATVSSGQQVRVIRGTTNNWTVVPVDTHTHAASDITSGTLTHERGGLEADVSAYNGLVKISGGSTSAVTVTSAGEALLDDADAAAQRTTLGLGTAATAATGDFAAASHTHTSADINSQTASNGHVLTANGSGGASFAALPASGISNVDSTLADVMSVSGSNLVADDGGLVDSSNPVLTWDDAAGKAVWANPLRRTAAGAFYVGVAPTTTALGTRAINIQADRSLAADRVAQGTDCVVIGNSAQTANISAATAIGFRARANNTYATCIGGESVASGNASIAIGAVAAASGAQSINISAYDAYGGNSSSATNSVGLNATADLRAMFATAAFRAVYWGGQTTNNTATILNLDATATNRFTIAANTALIADIFLIARSSDNTKFLSARRSVAIYRDNANVTALIGNVQTLGNDQSVGSPTWSIAVTADNTNEALQLEVTGATGETVNWRATAFYRLV